MPVPSLRYKSSCALPLFLAQSSHEAEPWLGWETVRHRSQSSQSHDRSVSPQQTHQLTTDPWASPGNISQAQPRSADQVSQPILSWVKIKCHVIEVYGGLFHSVVMVTHIWYRILVQKLSSWNHQRQVVMIAHQPFGTCLQQFF